MADVSAKLDAMAALIEEGLYFIINRPRQYGKTTILYLLWRVLKEREDYAPIRISFEGIGSDSYRSEKEFIEAFYQQLTNYALATGNKELEDMLKKHEGAADFIRLGSFITEISRVNRKVVLMIDEVDKSSNNQLFLDFMTMNVSLLTTWPILRIVSVVNRYNSSLPVTQTTSATIS